MSYKFIILDSDPFYSHTSLCKRADPKMEHFVYPDTLIRSHGWQVSGVDNQQRGMETPDYSFDITLQADNLLT